MAKVHDQRLDDLLWHLSEHCGIEDVLVSAKEVNFFKPGTRSLVSQPDIVAVTRRGELYIVEYKCNDNRSDARAQLKRSKQYILNQFGMPVRTFYAHSKYRVEEIY